MIRLLPVLLLALAAPTHEQSTPVSPCPNVFMYEPPGSEPGRWYGVVNLSTDSTLHSLWLNIVLDSKADILGNWVGDVSTQDNIDFKVENTEMKINPGPAVAVRFFVQYNSLNKAPKLQAIRLNGREICNANIPQPPSDRPDRDGNSRPSRPATTLRPQSTSKPQYTTQPTVIRQEDRPQTRPVQGKPAAEGPVYVRPSITPATQKQPNPFSLDSSQGKPTQRPGNYFTTQPPRATTRRHQEIPDFDNDNFGSGGVSQGKPTQAQNYFTTAPPQRITTRRYQEMPDFDNSDRVSNGPSNPDDIYFTGGPIRIPVKNPSGNKPSSQEPQCGTVTLNPNPLVVNGKHTPEGQWPWQIALYQTQTVDNKYICGGTLVSHRHVLTAAHCITRKGSRKAVNQNTLTVYLGKHNLRTSVEGVQIRFVENILVHPEYNATVFSKDLAILELKEPVSYSDWVRPACLWPDNQVDLGYVVNKKGSVVGWGFDETGVATEELSLVEMPIVDTETCIRSFSDFFVKFTSAYTYCAGFRDGYYNENTGEWERTSVCNGDSGGGMVFKISGSWYVRGLVSVSVARENEYRCDPSHYVIFTDLAKFLPWIRDNIGDY